MLLPTLLSLLVVSQTHGFNPCNDTDGQAKKTDDLYLCYNKTSFTSTVWIPFNSFYIGGYKAEAWKGYDWYLSTEHLILNFHTLNNPLLEKPPKSQKRTHLVPTLASSSNCYHLTLFIYKSGKDPHHFVSIYEPNGSPALSAGPLSKTMKTAIIVGPKLKPDDWFRVTTGITGHSNNWLLLAEQAAQDASDDCMVCLGPRPILRVVPAPMEENCLTAVMNHTNIQDKNCTKWDRIFPITNEEKRKPIFSQDVMVANHTCINMIGPGERLGSLNATSCLTITKVDSSFKPRSRADVWWWCGDLNLYDRLPNNWIGMCGLVSLLLPIQVVKLKATDITITAGRLKINPRQKRSAPEQPGPDPTYIDAIGIPRGVPDEYKLVDQVAAGFESSVCWWCTINKNVDRINYIHYNVQRLGNLTQSGFHAVAEQLRATSLMSFQNRIALDMLLSEKNGVCSMFGEQCCTFIPNNTAADGSLTRALEGLKTLNEKMKEHSGVDTSTWDNWIDMFEKYRSFVSSIQVSVAVFAAILTLCGCCCIPCIRALINRLIATAITPHVTSPPETMMLLENNESDTDSEEEEDNI
uniref:Envelope glycoprotein n=1 Tax=Astatotilapia calliptera TaxID=8154 RepID=A0A3P8P7H0_ASTCA